MTKFRGHNTRQDSVQIFSVSGLVETPQGTVGPGAKKQYSAPEGEYWIARDSSGDTVAVHQVSNRVAEWTIASAPTGSPVSLESPNVGDFNESLDPNPRFLAASGALRAVMLFVDFPGDEATGQDWADEKNIVSRIVGDAPVELQKVSLGALALAVDSVLGWQRMPRPAAYYSEPSCGCLSSKSERFIEDAVRLYGAQVDFSQYEIVYIVAAKSRDFALSPAWAAEVGHPIIASTGEIRYAVTFGEDSYDPQNKTFLLLHETYHLLGLPDLYDGGQVSGSGFSDSGLGAWDLMANQGGDSGLLAWHRLKLGWLHPSQMICLYGAGTIEVVLADWTSPDGVKGIMTPVTISQNVKHASFAYVVEVANPAGGGLSSGVLVYSVNAALPTWERPILMRGGTDALSPDPIAVGAWYHHLNGDVRVEVVSGVKDGFRVRVEKG